MYVSMYAISTRSLGLKLKTSIKSRNTLFWLRQPGTQPLWNSLLSCSHSTPNSFLILPPSNKFYPSAFFLIFPHGNSSVINNAGHYSKSLLRAWAPDKYSNIPFCYDGGTSISVRSLNSIIIIVPSVTLKLFLIPTLWGHPAFHKTMAQLVSLLSLPHSPFSVHLLSKSYPFFQIQLFLHDLCTSQNKRNLSFSQFSRKLLKTSNITRITFCFLHIWIYTLLPY